MQVGIIFQKTEDFLSIWSSAFCLFKPIEDFLYVFHLFVYASKKLSNLTHRGLLYDCHLFGYFSKRLFKWVIKSGNYFLHFFPKRIPHFFNVSFFYRETILNM